MKRRRLNPTDDTASQYQTLRQIPSLKPHQCRAVVQLLREDDAGGRTCQRQAESHPLAFPCLHTLTVPGKKADATVQVHCMSLPRLVQAKVDTCPLYRDLLRQTLKANDNTLSLIVYSDEVTGGNVLNPDLNKKANLCYVQWLQMPILFVDSLWLTVNVMKHKEIQACRHGFASVTRSILEFLKSETSRGFAVNFGCNIDPEMVFVNKVLLLADHEAHRAAIGCKGASGTKPCLKCLNVTALNKAVNVKDHADISCSDVTRFWIQTDESVRAVVETLKNQPNKSCLETAETLLGWNLAALVNGPLMAPALRDWVSMSSIMYDSMHEYWSNGVIGQELAQWFAYLHQEANLELHHLRTYSSLWSPVKGSFSQSSAKPEALFGEKLWKIGSDYRGSAQQCDLALTLCVGFSEEVLRGQHPHLADAFDSLKALKAVCVCLQETKIDASRATALPALQKKHMDLHARAYGVTNTRPKLHYALHLQQQVTQHNKMIDCFCCERKHASFKSLVQGQGKGCAPGFSKSVLLELVSRELHTPHEAERFHGKLLGQARETDCLGKPPVVSSALEYGCVRYCREQCIILSPTCAVEIVCAVKQSGKLSLLAQMLDRCDSGDVPSTITRWKHSENSNKFVLLPMNTVPSKVSPLYRRISENGSVSLLQ